MIRALHPAEWHGVGSRETKDGGEVTVENNGDVTFRAPFAQASPAVLYLKGVER